MPTQPEPRETASSSGQTLPVGPDPRGSHWWPCLAPWVMKIGTSCHQPCQSGTISRQAQPRRPLPLGPLHPNPIFLAHTHTHTHPLSLLSQNLNVPSLATATSPFVMPLLRPAAPCSHPPTAWDWHSLPILTERPMCAQHRTRPRGRGRAPRSNWEDPYGCGLWELLPPTPCPGWWALTFFGHKVDEAAPHLHLGRLDLTLARGCPSANTKEVMSLP